MADVKKKGKGEGKGGERVKKKGKNSKIESGSKIPKQDVYNLKKKSVKQSAKHKKKLESMMKLV